jgi:acyl-CoA synthetase (AMP-forming)/AMP-acid ligase II/aryl carrier-like protein
VLTHRNIVTNICAITEGAKITGADVTLSWMPLTHDMGLVGFHLTPLFNGIDQVIMSTDLFIRRPVLWLEVANRGRATLLCSPNFGYRHYLRAAGRRAPRGLDLAHVRLIFNGAEPISASLCEHFLAHGRSLNLRPSVMFPVYGLAEASLAVTFPDAGSGLRTLEVERGRLGIGDRVQRRGQAGASTVRLVCVGRPIRDCRLRIVGDTQRQLDAGTVGRIQITGGNVTAGYYRDEAANREAFSDDGWLDTGDLGFVFGGELYITGRSKDVIFVNGQNHYPQDIESMLDGHEGVELGKVAACGVPRPDGGGEEVLIFVLYRGETEAFSPLARSVIEYVNHHAGLEVAHVIPVHRIPKTTSGKLQRHLLAERYLRGEFAREVQVLQRLRDSPDREGVARTAIEHRLRQICDTVLGDRRIAVDDSLFDAGVGSLALVQIHEMIEESFPGQIEIADLFDHPTIAALAEFLQSREADAPQGR